MALHESAIGLTLDEAHELALREEAIRAKKPTAAGWLISNRLGTVAHRVRVFEKRGAAGTLFGYGREALCGARLTSAWGSQWTETPPLGFGICDHCGRRSDR
jgi:hypothetical protein